MRSITIMLFLMCAFSIDAMAWDGYDYERGAYIEIDKGNLVRQGQEIEYYDFSSGEYKSGDVESISGSGSSVEVEIYDHDSGEHRTFDMEN